MFFRILAYTYFTKGMTIEKWTSKDSQVVIISKSQEVIHYACRIEPLEKSIFVINVRLKTIREKT